MENQNTENTNNSNERPTNNYRPQRRSFSPHSSRPGSHNNHNNSNNTNHSSSHGNSQDNRHRSNSPNRMASNNNNAIVRKTQRKPRNNNRPRTDRKPQAEVPPIGDNIRIVPLGGVEEVGKNMTAIEIGNDIIVIDAGFQFKDENTPGIDYILPNTKYLEERKDKIRGLFITHGHLDHIGALPFIIGKIGNPPIYSRQFGAIMIQKRQEEFPQMAKINMNIIDKDETIVISDKMKVETFSISHTIPDSMGLVIHTHMGDIVFVEDVRVDNIAGVPTDEEEAQYKRFMNKEHLLLTMDSTSIEKPGWSLSENVVADNIKKIMGQVSGRLIIATFASQVERIVAIIETAQEHGKKVLIEGRSMKTNIEIAKQLKLLKTDSIAPISDLDTLPPDRIVMLVTGGQGEEFAALTRMASDNHKYVKLRETDTILLSSSIIPTNHSAISRLKDNLYRSKAKVITYLDSDVHASGHGNREELKWIHNHVKYKFFMPVHGNHYMLRQHAELSQSLGTPPSNIIVPDNGSIIEISDNGNKIGVLPMKAPNERVTVDGFSISDVQDVVLRDRQMLSESGIFVIVASINTKTGRLKKSPDIISRGFIYLRESQELLREARNIIKRTIERNIRGKTQIDFDVLKDIVAKEISQYLFQQTAKEPLVIPVILGV